MSVEAMMKSQRETRIWSMNWR